MEDPTKHNNNDRLLNFASALVITSRKFMDGNHSSVLYNTTMLLDHKEWLNFLSKVINAIDHGVPLRQAFTDAVEYGTPAMNLLGTAAKMMDDLRDWRSEDDGPGWSSLESGIKHCGGWPTKEVKNSEQA